MLNIGKYCKLAWPLMGLMALQAQEREVQKKERPATEAEAKAELTPEDLIAARAVPYRPAITRDPFSSPTDLDLRDRGDMIEDIAVKGITKMNGKTFAVVSDSRGNVRWLPKGYRFKDGEIVEIDDKAVTFHQWDVNSSVRAYRTVQKTFKREEGKR